jgi:hypothetical protein
MFQGVLDPVINIVLDWWDGDFLLNSKCENILLYFFAFHLDLVDG